ncbi:MAG: ADP-forming succinate--CoA ligase subunit beta [Bacillota bacterium]|nr:ADP-forming succinate--CoA ligase subunit beta [Bacillota bacterium]
MKLLEYKAKELFDQYGIRTPEGIVIDQLDSLDKKSIAREDSDFEGLNQKLEELEYPVVVKAQVQVGGRGKAGGVRFANTPDEAREICNQLLYSDLKGLKVNELLVVKKISGTKEWYLSITLDRLGKTPMIIFSPQGGIDIEETAVTNPDKIIKIGIDPLVGIEDHIVHYIIDKSGIGAIYFDEMSGLLKKLYSMFMDTDCLLAEINPLIVTADHQIIAADGKVDVDDSALYRQPNILAFRDKLQENPLIIDARKFRLLYIPIDTEGDIAVMSNGSGMIMSCIDLISKDSMKVGAALDLGGGCTSDRIYEGIRILLSNSKLKTLFISIFGGITRCDEVANGVGKAVKHLTDGKSIVIRMEGTNKEKGLEILGDIQGNIVSVDSIREGIKALKRQRVSNNKTVS